MRLRDVTHVKTRPTGHSAQQVSHGIQPEFHGTQPTDKAKALDIGSRKCSPATSGSDGLGYHAQPCSEASLWGADRLLRVY